MAGSIEGVQEPEKVKGCKSALEPVWKQGYQGVLVANRCVGLNADNYDTVAVVTSGTWCTTDMVGWQQQCSRQGFIHCGAYSALQAADCSLCCCFLCCCSLSVNAEPFGNTPQPVPLDLLDLPPGLTRLELRNIDVTSRPADLAAAAAPQPPAAAAAAPAVAATVAEGGTPTAACWPAGLAGLQAAAALRQPQQPRNHFGLGSGSGSSSGVSSNSSSGGSSNNSAGRCSEQGGSGSGVPGVLRHLESFKLESCRLRAAQLQVRATWALEAASQIFCPHCKQQNQMRSV